MGLRENFEKFKNDISNQDITKTVTSLTAPTPDFIGQLGKDANGNNYVAIALTGTCWALAGATELKETGEYMYAITDSNNKVVFGIKEDGTLSASTLTTLEARPTGSLFGKEFYSLGDSLSTPGTWQAKLAELSGAIFDNTKNIDATYPLSVGGTATLSNLESCGQFRAKYLLANYPNAEVIFIQNINDYNIYDNGLISDAPFMIGSIYNYPDAGLTSSSEADAYFAANFSTIVGTYTPEKGVCINIPYYGSGKNLQITGLPSTSGTITLTVNSVNSVNYAIEVLSTDTIADIIAKILEYQYGIVNDTANADGISVDFYYSGGATVSFTDTDSTGMTVSITDTATAQVFRQRYFIGEVAEWTNSAKWVPDFSVTLYSIYKGLLEFLITNFPTADIYFMIPTRYALTLADYQKADGTPDIDAYMLSTGYTKYDALCEVQKAVCDLYGIRYIDVYSNSGITLFNFSTYYDEANVHPKTAGYEKWGETINKLLK